MTDTVRTQQNSAVNSAQKITNQRLGTIAQNLGSQSGDVTTSLAAIAAAINAKPAA